MKLIPCSISKYKSSLNSGNGLPETQSKLIMHLLSSQSFLIIKQVYITAIKEILILIFVLIQYQHMNALYTIHFQLV